MKKEVILTLFALASITLAGCAQADKSAFESSVAETAPTVTTVAAAETVPETTTVTASSETTAATVTTTTTASKVTTTAKETKKQPSSEATTTKKKTVTTSKKATTVTTTKAKAIVTQKMSGTMYTNQAANMRKGNSTNYDKVTTLPMNTAVTITGKCDNGWYAVNAAGYSGYMSGSVLSSEKTVQKPVTTTTAKQQEVTNKKPTSKEDQARAVAKKIAKEVRSACGNEKSEEQIFLAELLVNKYVQSCVRGENSDPVTYTAYGVFIARKCDCYGTAEALGMVLEELGYKWKKLSADALTASGKTYWNEVYFNWDSGYGFGGDSIQLDTYVDPMIMYCQSDMPEANYWELNRLAFDSKYQKIVDNFKI